MCMIFVAVLFMAFPSDKTYIVALAIISFGLAIDGIRDIIFYFTMARHMVGGKIILFQGVIILDFALLTGSLTSIPKIYILLYLIGIHAFSGVVEILRSMESKKTVEGPWKLKFAHGLINFLIAFACLICISRSNTALLIYSLGLIGSAIVRIFSAFRKTAFIVIE